jgi:hypothetical protein
MEIVMEIKNSMKKMVISLAVLSIFTVSGCATSDLKNIVSDGNAMSTTNSKTSPTNPNKVRLFYSGNEKPRYYKMVGKISAENYNIVGMEHTQSSIAEELKKQAASIGANGVININSGMAQTTGDAVIIK